MKFTAFHLMQSPNAQSDAAVNRNEADLMVHAEELGFDGVRMAEHHFHDYCITPDPLLLATAGTPDSLQLAGRLGISFYVSYQSRVQFEKHKQVFIDAARAAGRSEAEIARLVGDTAVMQTSYVAATNEQSYQEAKAAVDWMAQCVRSVNTLENLEWWPEAMQKILRVQIEGPDRGYEDYDGYWKAFIYGDPARAVERAVQLMTPYPVTDLGAVTQGPREPERMVKGAQRPLVRRLPRTASRPPERPPRASAAPVFR